MTPTSEDPLPKLRADLDQAIAGMAEFARLVHGYFTQCVAAGFSERQALSLTVAYQRHLLSNGAADDDEG